MPQAFTRVFLPDVQVSDIPINPRYSDHYWMLRQMEGFKIERCIETGLVCPELNAFTSSHWCCFIEYVLH